MQAPANHPDENLRIHTLRTLSLLDTPAEERFDRLTRLARRLFDVPIAVVSLVDTNRQWFKSCSGLSATQTPRDVSFCGHAILQNELFVISDAIHDPRFSDNPLVVGEPHIRFYAGRPLKASNGSPMGTLCLIDRAPRQFDDEDRAAMEDLAIMAELELEAQQVATVDHLTQVANRRGFEHMAEYALSICRRVGTPATLLFFDLDGFKAINDRFGHAEGDRALAVFADVLRSVVREMDSIGRLGGDEFVVLLMGAGQGESVHVLQRLDKALATRNRDGARGYEIAYSVGRVEYDLARHDGLPALLADADTAMYRHKHRR
ncbi:diguanylate cyclase [Pseudomonas sp. NPDC007930]|uniref:GGDEF domain-containing protein n=1 Tax=Pseudomonas sp. NPDC007930 TaxID=3364417 RepID=UPI0036E25F72